MRCPFVVPLTVAAGGVATAMLVGVGRNGRGAGMQGRLSGSVGLAVGGNGGEWVRG